MATKNNTATRVKLGVLWRVVAVLLVAALGSSVLVAAPLAKFATTSSVSDSARVAKYDVQVAKDKTQSTESFTLNASNKTADYKFTVKNNSEVSIKYDVKLTLPAAMPGVTPTLTNGTTPVSGTVSENGMTYTFANAGSLAAGAGPNSLTLTFTLGDTSLTGRNTFQDIKLDVVATQAN